MVQKIWAVKDPNICLPVTWRDISALFHLLSPVHRSSKYFEKCKISPIKNKCPFNYLHDTLLNFLFTHIKSEFCFFLGLTLLLASQFSRYHEIPRVLQGHISQKKIHVVVLKVTRMCPSIVTQPISVNVLPAATVVSVCDDAKHRGNYSISDSAAFQRD